MQNFITTALFSSARPTYRRRGLNLVLRFMIGGLILASCETVVDVDIPYENPRLVPNAFLEAGQPVQIELSQSLSVLRNNTIALVSGATVTLLEEGETVATAEESDEVPGTYYASFVPSVGKNYTLQISKKGYESVEATMFIRPPVAIREVAYDTTLLRNTYDYGDSIVVEDNVEINEIRLTFDDPADERNYYEVLAYHYEVYVQEIYDTDGNYLRTDTVQYYSPQYLTSDDPALTGGGGDFLEGDDEVYGETLMFGDDFLNGKTYTLRFNPQAYFGAGQEDGRLYVTLRTISEAQYRYFRSADLQYENDGNPFAEPVQVYSNVENGYGIFAGFSTDVVELRVK